jgi:hypothetical protein
MVPIHFQMLFIFSVHFGRDCDRYSKKEEEENGSQFFASFSLYKNTTSLYVKIYVYV